MPPDYYEVLGISRDATPAELQEAYRKLARAYHPDVNPDPIAEERFKEINEAYHVLSDAETRRRYDRHGPAFRQISEDFDRATAGTGARSGRRSSAGARSRSYASNVGFDFDDLFDGLFGARAATGAVRGADQEVELQLSVPEAFHGGQRQITVGGGGAERSFRVAIPPGVVDGQRIRLAGQGGRGTDGADAGDLYLVVRIAPHPRYRLDGRDIHVDLPVSPWEAALGATVPLSTPAGETKAQVPPNSSTGRRLRLRGEGMPHPKGTPGDLYAEVKIVMPPTLSADERKLFEKLAGTSTFDPRKQQ